MTEDQLNTMSLYQTMVHDFTHNIIKNQPEFDPLQALEKAKAIAKYILETKNPA